MAFIVIEKHGGWEHASICINEQGATKVFDKLDDAFKEADDCQDGIVVGDEKVDVDPDEEAFLKEFSNNISILERYIEETEVPKELKKAINNLSKLKSQLVV